MRCQYRSRFTVSIAIAAISRAIRWITHATSQAILISAWSISDISNGIARVPANVKIESGKLENSYGSKQSCQQLHSICTYMYNWFTIWNQLYDLADWPLDTWSDYAWSLRWFGLILTGNDRYRAGNWMGYECNSLDTNRSYSADNDKARSARTLELCNHGIRVTIYRSRYRC